MNDAWILWESLDNVLYYGWLVPATGKCIDTVKIYCKMCLHIVITNHLHYVNYV